MEGDLKFVYKPESTCNSLSLDVKGMNKNPSMSLLLGNIRISNISCKWIPCQVTC